MENKPEHRLSLAKNASFLLVMLRSSLVRRRSRLAAALFGIAIGAAVLLGMVTLCYDLPRQMSREFRSYGANMVLVSSRWGSLDLGDAAKAAGRFPQGTLIGMTPLRYLPVRNNMLPYTAVGTDFASIAKTSPYWRVTGSWPATDTEVLVGTDIAEYARLSPGATLVLDGRNSGQEKFEAEMRVTGVVATGGVEDGFIFMRLSAMEAMTGERGMADVVEISCNAGEKELLRISGEIRADIPALDPRLVKRVTRSEATVLGKLEMLVWLVTLIVLVLSMICVGTTMMTMVMERSREIGLKKALGAGNRRIAGEFLAEGVLLGLAGGLGGGLCGLLFAQLVSAGVFGRSVTVALGLLPATVAASVLVTVVACLLPARRAMDIEPALVLRGE